MPSKTMRDRLYLNRHLGDPFRGGLRAGTPVTLMDGPFPAYVPGDLNRPVSRSDDAWLCRSAGRELVIGGEFLSPADPTEGESPDVLPMIAAHASCDEGT